MWDWCQARYPCDSFSHTRKRKRLCRQGVQRIQGHERVEFGPNNNIIIQLSLLNCQTDLFASRLTTQLTDYISWRPDPGAIHTDAFTIINTTTTLFTLGFQSS